MTQRTVRLVRSHTHAGRPLEVGAQLVVDERKAEWLIDQGAAVPVGDWKPQRAALLTPPALMRTAESTTAPAKRASTGCRGCGSAR